MALPMKLALLTALVVVFCTTTTTTEAAKRKQTLTRIQFYLHEIRAGPKPSVVRVAGRPNFTSPNPILASFGSISIMDNPLLATPNPKSLPIGRAQGLFALSSMEEISILMSATYIFTAGPYNGSSFSLLGRNPALEPLREIPIVGGTGVFRLARGYCFVRTHAMSQTDAMIGYNVTLIY
ncbi:dirigent protein 1-like [Tripterygium wilfordii]|uniref:dirigent protein 1-like n=1 Tax=Tripterygium wilfordii TaxID=458696 RepID=UPI0018F7F66E|nr:dirigent protein 1-like [Tripterygium wilfordii]